MDAILLQILNGLDKGGAYALIALGLTLVFGTLGVVNFAHGALFMLGAFCAVTFNKLLNLESVVIDPAQTTAWGSPLEVRTFLDELKLLLTYIGVSDCNMQEGSLRVDANVNLHIDVEGQLIATPIVEIKNMNSFRAVERALAYEAQRQFDLWRQTRQKIGDVPKETRG